MPTVPNLQTARTLSVSSEAIPVFLGAPILEPVRLAGHEGLNSLFAYELLLKTPDALNLGASQAADIDLDALIGKEISCRIQLDGSGSFVPSTVGAASDHIGAGVREINAIIGDAEFCGEEGRHIQYRFWLRPWLYLASKNRNSRIFQNKTVEQILDEVLGLYHYPVEKRLIDSYPVRDYQVQFCESDFEFVSRLCEEWGISYHFEHSKGHHRLVLVDNPGAYFKMPSEGYQLVDYHPPGLKIEGEYVSRFASHHRLTAGRHTTRDYSYTSPRADLTVNRQDHRPTRHNLIEVYDFHGRLGGAHFAQPKAGTAPANDPLAEGRQIALVRVEAQRSPGLRAEAGGNLRGIVPGHTFSLQGHPRKQANTEYMALETHLLIEDVDQASQIKDAAATRRQGWRVEVSFIAHPMSEPLRPAPVRTKPQIGLQSAVVVGAEGENIWTDGLARIKVQFHWDREGQKNQHSSCWVRVSSQWAGNQLGAVHLPRIGQEVNIQFYGDDADLPVCVGMVYNQNNLPPFLLPSQAALSGIRSRELTPQGGNSAAGRSNQMVMDDTAGGIQVQLKSDHQHSQLSLGAITRIEDNAGRKDARGEGFELATGAHGALRAAKGLLVSTEERPKAQAHTTDMAETVARLTEARDRHEALGNAAQEAKAQNAGDQDQVAQALKAQNDAIRGAGTPSHPESGRFPELSRPHLVLASAAGLHATSTESTHLHAQEHVAFTSGAHTSVSAGQSLLASAVQAVRFFAYRAGMRLVAYAGDIEIKALKDSIAIMAQLNITETAETISIAARKELMLNGGGSYFKLNAGGIEGATAGPFRLHAATHNFVGPRNAATPTLQGQADLKDVPTARGFVLRSHADDGRAMAMEPYTLYRDGAEVAKGVTDPQGQMFMPDHQKGTGSYRVKLSNGNTFDLPVVPALQSVDAQLAARGYRAAHGNPQERAKHAEHRQGGPGES